MTNHRNTENTAAADSAALTMLLGHDFQTAMNTGPVPGLAAPPRPVILIVSAHRDVTGSAIGHTPVTR